MKSQMRFVSIISLFILSCVSITFAQPTGQIVAGQVSPWTNAHFVIMAYGAVWVGLVLYVLRLALLARSLDREAKALKEMIEDDV